MKGEMGGKNGTMNFNVEIERELRIKTRTSSKWGRGFIEISQVNEREVWGGVLHSEIVTPEAGVSDLSREEYSRILRRRRLCKNFPSTNAVFSRATPASPFFVMEIIVSKRSMG